MLEGPGAATAATDAPIFFCEDRKDKERLGHPPMENVVARFWRVMHGKVYRRRFMSPRLTATLLDGAP